MDLFSKSLLIAVIGVGLSTPVFAQPKADAGSGPTKGAVSTDDAGSGPTNGAKPAGEAASGTTNTENSAGVTPGPKSTGGAQPVTPAMPEKK